MSLRTQLFFLQLLIVLIVVLVAGSVAVRVQEKQIRSAYEARMVTVAQSVAELPAIVQAFDDPDPSATIQPIAELIAEATNVTYVVVTDDAGIRYSHPNPALIGKPTSTDPSIALSGRPYVGTQTGTLGESWRVKLPIYDGGGTIIGMASVGILEATLTTDLREVLPELLLWLVGAALVGTAGAIYVSRLAWRRIYRLEPEQIAALLETRDAMLHGIGEGVAAIDASANIALLNDEARRLLAAPGDVVGRPAAAVLGVDLARLLKSGSDADETILVGERVLLARASDAVVDGRLVGRVIILRDRTELHQLLSDLDGARDVTAALRAQAHEFSNKMHVISGLVELGRIEQAVDFISRSGHGGSVISGGLAPGITDPDVASLLMAKSTISAEKGITLVVDADSVLAPDGTTDSVTVLGNLVDNAIDAVGSGGRVHVSIRSWREQIDFTVSDDGPGVAEADRLRIFQPGLSSKDATHPGGRGFGLALVSRVARRRHGFACAGDSADNGAEFTVRFDSALDLPVRPPTQENSLR
ncbi:ATP-binding protein [Cryobacterium roopkundense]|uniref:histidine kinase n=2 Tax=Cryobacterium roopkundense TaxID=1001240 RepID=A0A7W9E483_9MICO|nr:sensor histidine kinase [Cryobacterium roopkundense]MBB5641154.1 two-component system CitB family sensor kinase [Cryobacterium roopkundense]